MYIDVVPNRTSPPAILLRESYRDGNKVRKRTLLNLTSWPRDLVVGFRALLKGGTVIPAGQEALTIIRSQPHGHVAAVLSTLRRAVEWRRQPIELFLVETGEVEIEPGGVECVQFRCQQLLIPLTRQHQLVIGNAVRPHLLCAQVRQPNDRDFCEPQV